MTQSTNWPNSILVQNRIRCFSDKSRVYYCYTNYLFCLFYKTISKKDRLWKVSLKEFKCWFTDLICTKSILTITKMLKPLSKNSKLKNMFFPKHDFVSKKSAALQNKLPFLLFLRVFKDISAPRDGSDGPKMAAGSAGLKMFEFGLGTKLKRFVAA